MAYLRSCRDLPVDSIVGSLVGRETGQRSIYVLHSGGYRAVRDRMDAIDIWYDTFAPSRYEAAEMAFRVSEYLLEDLPGRSVESLRFLDVREQMSPRFRPDNISNEVTFSGELRLYVTYE